MPWHVTLHGELSGPPSRPGLVEYRTLHGETPVGLFTLTAASLSEGPSGLHSMPVKKTTWTGWQLLHGEHVEDDEDYKAALFKIPGLLHWLGPTGLNAHMTAEVHAGGGRWARPEEKDELEQLTASVDDDLRVALGPSYSTRIGRAGDSKTYHGQYVVTSTAGVKLEVVNRLSAALADLHAIVTGSPMQAFDLQLVTEDEKQLRVVDGGRPLGRRWGKTGHADPFFDTAEIEFESFIPRWLRLCQELPVAVAAAVPRDNGQFVQSQFIDACNGLEALAAHKWADLPMSDPDQQLLDKLKDLGVNRNLRDAVKLTLRMRRFPLHKKLERLAGALGEQSATWLLGDPVSTWAELSATFRNSLAHGFAMKGGLGDDDLFVVMTHEAARLLLSLALLQEAGYDNKRSPKPGELLWQSGRRNAGHPNSDLFHGLKFVAHHADYWARWKATATSRGPSAEPSKAESDDGSPGSSIGECS